MQQQKTRALFQLEKNDEKTNKGCVVEVTMIFKYIIVKLNHGTIDFRHFPCFEITSRLNSRLSTAAIEGSYFEL